jgi:hypothetical protein
MFAKNHFGSHTRPGAKHLHGGLVAPEEYPNAPYRMDYGMYRVQVDLMGHQLLGRKCLFYLMDALWATDYELDVPVKWAMPPFNNDWSSSVFASLDPVAIESVGYDFLRAEFTAARGAGTYPQMNATDDYLHQAADSTNWPAGVRYDPENDGTVLGSLGTHEHWNDELHMQYSRNLGTGSGIELVGEEGTSDVHDSPPTVAGRMVLEQNYPNPFNPTTNIRLTIVDRQLTTVKVFDVQGREVATLLNEVKDPGTYTLHFDGSRLASGMYCCRMQAGDFVAARKLLLVR